MTKDTKHKMCPHTGVGVDVCACIIYFDAVLINLQIIFEANNYFAQSTNHTSLNMCEAFKKTKVYR